MNCTPVKTDTGFAFACGTGRGKRNCKYCGRPTTKLCDYPVIRAGRNATCDTPMCDNCTINVGVNKDLCRPHYNFAAKKGEAVLSDVKTVSVERQALNDLESETCLCGKAKNRKQSFCRSCYFSLPEKLRSALYAPFSEGYAQNYQDACDWLRNEQ